MKTKNPEGEFSEQEIAQRRDELAKRVLDMPPKPHSEMKLGKSPKPSSKVSPSKNARQLQKNLVKSN